MATRLVLILALLAQPLAGATPTDRGRVARCEGAACCAVVRTTTCCGTIAYERHCGRTGLACRCASDEPAPTPNVPRPPERSDPAPMLAAAGAAPALDLPAPVRAVPGWARPAVHRTHNEARALLCIWRT